MLGYNPAKASDTAPTQLSGVVKELTCLAAFRDESCGISVAEAQTCLGIVQVGFLIAADDRDMPEILETAQGLNYVLTDTLSRGIQSAILSGNLLLWRDAIRVACSTMKLSQATREVYNEAYNILCRLGLTDIFQGARIRTQPDQTFLLTDK